MLTPRELKVLEFLADGKSFEDIRKELHLESPLFSASLGRLRVKQIASKAVRKAKFYSGFFEKHRQTENAGAGDDVMDIPNEG